MKAQLAKDITDIKQPSFSGGATKGVPMCSDEEYNAFMAGDGKNLVWNNYFQKLDDNSEYRGQWAADRKEYTGIGEIKYKTGAFTMYQGFTKKKKYHGKGRLTWKNDDVYQGEFKNGKREGYGVMKQISKETGQPMMYMGFWKNDKREGKGTEIYGALPEKNLVRSCYIGQFANDVKTGDGKYETEGDKYSGEQRNGVYHGQGKLYYAKTGKTYEGEFKEGVPDGKGVLVWPDQSRYEGPFKNGKQEGVGTHQLNNGNRYVGNFQDDKYHGVGLWYDVQAQTKRQGEWQFGKRAKWLGEAQESHVSGYGAQGSSTKPTEQRTSQKSYLRGGQAKWRQDMATGLVGKFAALKELQKGKANAALVQ